MSVARSYRLPNLIIGARVVLAFVAAALLAGGRPAWVVAGVILILVVIAMDGLDGLAARRLGVASRLGSVLDITADRIVEHVFWITFAVAHQVALWVPLLVMTRSFLVDAVRGLALARGRTAFGAATMARSRLSRFLTASRLMRNAYGTAKVVAFVLLGSLMAHSAAEARGTGMDAALYAALEQGASFSVLLAVALCVIRGLPVILEGRHYVAAAPSQPTAGGSA